MIKIKKIPQEVLVFELGIKHPMEKEYIERGFIVRHDNDIYEVRSQEAKESGEFVHKGDFIKQDTSKYPYPCPRDFFISNHVKTEKQDTYIQKSVELQGWIMDERIRSLILQGSFKIIKVKEDIYFKDIKEDIYLADTHKIVLKNDNTYTIIPKTEKTVENVWELEGIILYLLKHEEFSIQERYIAKLCGTIETSPLDSTIVFYDIPEKEGKIVYNFVAKQDFENTYIIIC